MTPDQEFRKISDLRHHGFGSQGFEALPEPPAPKPKPKLMVVGHARHGKDTVCDMLAAFGYTFRSSSLFCAERVVRPWLKHTCGIEYETVEDCYEGRHKHRKDWFDAIADYNLEDPSRLTREILAEYDIYAGCRNHRELMAGRLRKVFDLIVYVDAHDRVPPEPSTSMTIEPWMADVILDNSGTLAELKTNVDLLHIHWLQPLEGLAPA